MGNLAMVWSLKERDGNKLRKNAVLRERHRRRVFISN